MLMQNFGATNKKHYGMLWYFLEWSIRKCLGTINESAKFDIMFKESRMFVTRIFEPLHELLWYYHSNETSSAKFPREI